MNIKPAKYPYSRIPPKFNYLCVRPGQKGPYLMIDKKGEIVGRMSTAKEFINNTDLYNPNKKDYYSLFIHRLYVPKEHRGKGIGSAFLKIAAAESYNRGCHGNVHVIAGSFENGAKPPQKIYRRAGFNSQYTSHIKMIDKAIAENTPLPPFRWVTPMYLEGKG